MSARLSMGKVRQMYRFVNAYQQQYGLEATCRVLDVSRNGYYAWLQEFGHQPS